MTALSLSVLLLAFAPAVLFLLRSMCERQAMAAQARMAALMTKFESWMADGVWRSGSPVHDLLYRVNLILLVSDRIAFDWTPWALSDQGRMVLRELRDELRKDHDKAGDLAAFSAAALSKQFWQRPGLACVNMVWHAIVLIWAQAVRRRDACAVAVNDGNAAASYRRIIGPAMREHELLPAAA